MRVVELFEEEPHISDVMKALSKEFRDLAKKYQLTVVAGMGWPQVTKDGAWMGGGLGPLRGISDEEAVLSIEKRRIAFLKVVARRLEELMKEGRTVKIARGGSRSVHQEVAEPGRVEEQLRANLVTETPPATRGRGQLPTVVWYVSAPAGASTTSFVNMTMSLHHMPGWRGFGATKTFRLPNDPAFEKALMKWLKQVKAGPEADRRSLVADLMKSLKEQGHALRSWSQQRPSPLDALAKDGQVSFGANKTRVAGRKVTVLDISTILPVLKKHGFTGDAK